MHDSSATRLDTNPLGAMRRPLLAALAVVGAFLGVTLTWSALAPLASAALAVGVVGVDSHRKTVQHLEGGIIRHIAVRDGQLVRAGEVLLQLDETQARATFEQLQFRYFSTAALHARLVAERDDADEVLFPTVLESASATPDVARAMRGELRTFETRREALKNQAAIVTQRIAQLEAETRGLQSQRRAADRQFQLVSRQLEALGPLVERRLASDDGQIELQREAAAVDGNRASLETSVARVGQRILEERLKLVELQARRLSEVNEQLSRTEARLFDLAERMRSARDVLDRTTVRAPADGVVVGLAHHTVGGVVSAGERLMDLVPDGDELVVNARVDPDDIDTVRPGLVARVVLTAYNRRAVAPLEGQVMTVSADSITDERSGAPYYLARIALDAIPVDRSVRLTPGMHAEVMIETGKRTVLDYLLSPLTRSFDRALRES